MRLIWFLLIAMLVLSIGSAVVGFLAEHFSNLSIWNSQTWKTWKIPLIVFIVVICFTLLLFVNYQTGKKAVREEREFALNHGWAYCDMHNDTDGIITKIKGILKKVAPDKEFDVRTVVAVKEGKENIYLIKCYYNQREGGKESHRGTACLIESERFPGIDSQVNIVVRSVLDAALLTEQVKTDNPDFDKAFILWSEDAGVARRVVGESLQTTLLEQKNIPSPDMTSLEIIFGHGGALILLWAWVLPEEWPPLIDMARRLESALR